MKREPFQTITLGLPAIKILGTGFVYLNTFNLWTKAETVIPMLTYKPNTTEPLGSVIRLHRKSAGLSMANFSKLTRISSTYICRIEHSNRIPSNSILHTFERVLELKPGELISHQGQSIMDLGFSILSNPRLQPIIFPYRVQMIKDELIESINNNLFDAKKQIRDRLLEF